MTYATETLPTEGPLDQRVMRPHAYRYSSDRVRVALRRLSRDRWMSGAEVRDAALRLAQCTSHNPLWTAQKSYPNECNVVGMLRGAPPAWIWEDDYRAFVLALRDLKATKPNAAELAILQLTLKRKTSGR